VGSTTVVVVVTVTEESCKCRSSIYSSVAKCIPVVGFGVTVTVDFPSPALTIVVETVVVVELVVVEFVVVGTAVFDLPPE
jgi:hypothetical protein